MQTQQPKFFFSLKDLQFIKNARVFIVGDVILDSYTEGIVSRISPEAPVPVLFETGKKYVPGGAGNVAANIAHFGAFAQICARVGHDIEATILREHLESFGVNTQALLVEDNSVTTTKTRIVSHHEFASNSHQIVRIDRELCNPASDLSVEKCLDFYKSFLAEGGACALVLSDYGKGFLTTELIQKLVEISNKNDIPVVTDPKSLDVGRYANSTIIKPNFSEGRHLFRMTNPENPTHFKSFEDEISTVAENYLTRSKCQNIVMSLSQKGVLIMGQDVAATSSSENTLHFETKALEVADVSGAGDTLIAFLAMSLAAKLPLHFAADLANLAAGVACGKSGTAVISENELFEKFHEHLPQTSIISKVFTLHALCQATKKFQQQNKTIVFTNGCFDILHAGHVEYLQKAKMMGDFLVIGLNTDDSIKRLKGASRPVQTFTDRAAILSALSCVDFVVEFNDDTPIHLIQAIKPDILVKGADYNLDNTVGAQDVISWGGHVKHIALLEGRSTTSILNRL